MPCATGHRCALPIGRHRLWAAGGRRAAQWLAREEGTIVRFRCHTGHASSLDTLLAEVSQSIDKGLWDTIRVLEERILLLRQMGDLMAGDDNEQSTRLKELADEAEASIKAIKGLVVDHRLFGRQG